MQELLDYLNMNSGAFNALFSGVVAISTVVYAVLTWRLVSETRKMRHAQTEPKVAVTYRSREEWMALVDIVVKNIGLGPAYDIKFEIAPVTDGGASQELIKELMERNFMNAGLSFLAPDQEVSSFFTNATDKFEEKMASRLSIKASYKSATGEQYLSEYLIDLSELRGMERIGEPPLYKIAKNVEKIAENIKGVASGNRRVKTDIYTSEDREKAEAERRAYYEEHKQKQQDNEPNPGS
jgi:hypothetical protein